MALCDTCCDLPRSFERDHIPEDQRRKQEAVEKSWGDPKDPFSTTAFSKWLLVRDMKGSIPETLPQLPGLMHSSWDSLCESLDAFCPVCWIVWRHIRESPTASYRDEVHQKFYLWMRSRYNNRGGTETLELLCSRDMKARDRITLLFRRTTKERYEEVVAKTPLEEHMGSKTTVDTVRDWLSKCDDGHSRGGDGCVAKRRAVNNPTIPTRLIDLHSHDSQAWSLIETKKDDDLPKYVALSHRWTADTPRLLKNNYLAFQGFQSDESFPGSYQDAFVLCRKLGIQYVWIDSLCIFQDSTDDFLHEAATMTEVYANAFCTFSICWESPCGFLRPRDPRGLARWDTCDEELSTLRDRYVFVKDLEELHTAVEQAPVNRRGWVLQEQLLSPRILYLGNDQFYWECDRARSCETGPIGFDVSRWDYMRENISHEIKRHTQWQGLVVQFMGLDLSFERDRLLAISGIARSFLSRVERTLPMGSNTEKKTEKSHQTINYVAGLLKRRWIESLLWYPSINGNFLRGRKLGSGSFNRRPDDIVPSWSWAACPGPIEWAAKSGIRPIEKMPGSHGGPMAYLRNINFEPLGSDVYGLPKSASLEISCLLVQARYASDRKFSGFYGGTGSPSDQTNDTCFYANTDGFLLPLPHPRTHSDGCSRITVLLEPCVNIMPTCYIVPLLPTSKSAYGISRIVGLVLQEIPQTDSTAKMREYVRIGSFSKRYDFGADEVIHALLKNLPVEGDEFEQRLRDAAMAWKEVENIHGDRKEKGTAKAEWTTIRLV